MVRSALLAVLASGMGAVHAQPPPELTYAVILMRHGVRSPTWTLERLNEYSASPWPDFGVPPGHLTPHGRAVVRQMGAYYRDLFSAEGLLSKEGCSAATGTYAYADTDQRTVESGLALLAGMFPGCEGEIHSSTTGGHDPLFDPVEAGRVRPDPNLALAAIIGRIGPKLDVLTEAYRPAFDALIYVLTGGARARRSIFDEPVALIIEGTTVAMTGPLRLASTFTENLLLEYVNGMKGGQLGWGRLNRANLQQMMMLHTVYADLLRRTSYVAGARGSTLLRCIMLSLEQAVSGKPVVGAFGPPSGKLLIISGHDTNISNLAGMLGLSWLTTGYQRDDVPPGSALIFSLWRSRGGRSAVRVQFLTQTLEQMRDALPLSQDHSPSVADLFVPACSSPAAGYPCEWPRFRGYLEQVVGASPGSSPARPAR